jgi:hypothetical protein
MAQNEAVLSTITGELFQPVRLHYQLFEQQALERAFEKLRCTQYDAQGRRWVWLFDHEAKQINLPKAYSTISKALHPIVIGSFFVRQADRLILDLRSCERAVEAIPFFDKHLPRRAAKVWQVEVVNRLFPVAGNEALTPARLFDQGTSTFVDPAAADQRMFDLTAPVQDPEEKMRILIEDSERRGKQPLPEIERFPIHYYEEGIQGLEMTLRLRQIVALQHWLGNADYSMFDAIQEMTKSM